MILKRGPAVARLFNGMFCLVAYERTARRMTIISDRYSARSLFYVRRHKALLFGTELKALAAADPGTRRIDEVGTLELFCYGSHFMDRTWMEGYLRLPAATILTVDATGLRITRYWSYRYEEHVRKLDQKTYATVFGILLDRAVERRMAGTRRIGIFLSGGYDSRSIAAAIRKHRYPLPAFTFGLPESRDVRFGTKLANRLGLEHHVLTAEGPYLYPNCRAIVWRTEGMITFANATSIQLHPILKEKMDIILTGFLGEFSGSHTWPQLLLARSRRAAIKVIFDRFLTPRLGLAQRIFQPVFFTRVFDAVRDFFYQSFETVENEHPLNVADSWNFMHLQPRGTFHTPAVDRHKFEMRAPHTDNDLVDFLLTIPTYARLEQRVYKKMIAYSFPYIRDVPCTNSAQPIEPNFAKEYVLMVSRYLVRKATGPFRSLLIRQPALGREFRDLSQDFRTEPELVNQVLRPLLRSGVFPDSTFKHAGIEQLIREHYERNASHHEILGLLISWGLAARYFLHDDVSDVPLEMYVP
jgi:asparagine synthetase B (glutamine-hydrolysing)